MKKRVMVIGSTGVGKTTLLEKLGLRNKRVKKTESVDVDAFSIDTPGEFLDIPRFYNALIVFSSKAKIVLLVVDAVDPKPFPSGISKVLRAVALGVINKIDLLYDGKELKIDLARKFLRDAGVKEVFEVSALTGFGLIELKKRIDDILAC
ncbi:MAG: EutP/PduV family microcompartment system protein [Synergistetes bacterium]|nr:EutP/PduV family microcompartment system protein [Synergistota bacterium]MCX8127764.1 EutP/PduV family microcompartment system protein [Synergistota bacterium]MDW8191320.1 EutP/PduV family microcompartment system protein [Synergistota bacterium]